MATVFSLLVSHQKNFEARSLNQKEKKWLGKKIAFNYNTDHRNTTDLPKVKSYEKEGEILVVDYPENFVPIIVKLIEDFYKMLGKKRKPISKRKRTLNFY